MHTHLRRLERVWIDAPMYFVTTCTRNRHAVLARNEVAQILLEEWCGARDRHGWAVGRYVIMPDHVHFFCRPECDAKRLSSFVMAWKSWTSRKINKLLRPRSTTSATTSFSLFPSRDQHVTLTAFIFLFRRLERRKRGIPKVAQIGHCSVGRHH
jgi:REP element-mobilizing transposase RayT